MIGPTRIINTATSETCQHMVRLAHRTSAFEYIGNLTNIPVVAQWALDLNRDLHVITDLPPTAREMAALTAFPNLVWRWTSLHSLPAVPPPTTSRLVWTPQVTPDSVGHVAVWAANLLLMGITTDPEIHDVAVWRGVRRFPFRVSRQTLGVAHSGTPRACSDCPMKWVTREGIGPCTEGRFFSSCLWPGTLGDPDPLDYGYSRVELLAVWWASGVPLPLVKSIWAEVSHLDAVGAHQRPMSLWSFQALLTSLVMAGTLRCPLLLPRKTGLMTIQFANYTQQMKAWADDGSWYLMIQRLKRHHPLGIFADKARLPFAVSERLHQRYGHIHTQRIVKPPRYIESAFRGELATPSLPAPSASGMLPWRAISGLRIRVHAAQLDRVEILRRPDPLAFLLADL